VKLAYTERFRRAYAEVPSHIQAGLRLANRGVPLQIIQNIMHRRDPRATRIHTRERIDQDVDADRMGRCASLGVAMKDSPAKHVAVVPRQQHHGDLLFWDKRSTEEVLL
jgi:hypothetical protein